MNFYELSVPVLLRYLKQLDKLLDKVNDPSDMLQKRLHRDMLPFAQQVNCTVGFALRTCFPLMKLKTPDISYDDTSIEILRGNIKHVLETLQELSPDQFIILQQEFVYFGAGHTDNIKLKALPYIQQYALPNFFFHLSIAYAILRANNIAIGKEDFDGLTSFPEGFSF